MAAKYVQLADILSEKIKKQEITERLPSENALCQQYQVSRQTVREALKRLEKLDLIEKKQGSGSFVKHAEDELLSPFSIAVVTTYISDYIFPSILRGIETTLAGRHCSPLLFATQNQISVERDILQRLLSLPDLKGIIVEGTKTALPNPNLDLYRKLMEKKIPIVFINGYYRDLPETVYILDDNYNGGRQLVEYLHEKGHTSIAGIFKSDDIQGHQRYAGYAAALRDLGLRAEDSCMIWYDTETKPYLTSLLQERFLRDLSACTAAVCYNDEVASTLIQFLLRQGLRVPEDYAVVSFDNSKYAEISAVHITSLSHAGNNLGSIAAETILKIINHESCSSMYVPWKLMERDSG